MTTQDQAHLGMAAALACVAPLEFAALVARHWTPDIDPDGLDEHLIEALKHLQAAISAMEDVIARESEWASD